MKKSKLIEMLSKIEGDPDIVLWNGFVGDFQNIDDKPIEGSLVKMTFAHYLKVCRLERCRDLNNQDFQFSEEEVNRLKASYRRYINWEDNQYVSEKMVKEKMYSSKRVVFIQPKQSGKTFHDRLGSVKY